jgi:hypothetical protein
MRKLRADEIECRVAQVNASGCSLLLYKTARTDSTILTEIYGELWQNDFKVIDGKMYGGIGVWNKELQQWIWRWDCGTESNTEAEKGQASDAFKRAGFKFLIGQELYKAPFIWLEIDTKKNDKGKYELANKYAKFEVTEIDYSDKGEIIKLKIADDKGNIVYELGKKQPKKKKEPEVNPDLDLLQGLEACSAYSEFQAYYKANYPNAKDKEAFNVAATNKANALKRKELSNAQN